jgi:5-oxoprolinase (ATP-hydrolysing)
MAGFDSVVTLDMGGTSADIGVAAGGQLRMRHLLDTKVGDYQAMVPMVDIDTIGAGGGSIAYVDDGGVFRAGPQSAGADPGPACYGRGGTEPTSTDAQLVLGRLRPDRGLLGSDSSTSTSPGPGERWQPAGMTVERRPSAPAAPEAGMTQSIDSSVRRAATRAVHARCAGGAGRCSRARSPSSSRSTRARAAASASSAGLPRPISAPVRGDGAALAEELDLSSRGG